MQRVATPPSNSSYRKQTPGVTSESSLVASALPEAIQEIREAPASPRIRNHKEVERGAKMSSNVRVSVVQTELPDPSHGSPEYCGYEGCFIIAR